MATVDFGTLEPPAEERAEIKRLAGLLPDDWRVRCSTAETPSGIFFVVVEEPAGTKRVRGSFAYERFDRAAEFLKEAVRRWGGS